jgi:hypothetical protein
VEEEGKDRVRGEKREELEEINGHTEERER